MVSMISGVMIVDWSVAAFFITLKKSFLGRMVKEFRSLPLRILVLMNRLRESLKMVKTEIIKIESVRIKEVIRFLLRFFLKKM